MPAVERIPPQRVALTIPEAAASVGMSLTKFRDEVLPELRVIRRGAWRAIPVDELLKWADREASLGRD